jgi:hypothetical protein
MKGESRIPMVAGESWLTLRSGQQGSERHVHMYVSCFGR